MRNQAGLVGKIGYSPRMRGVWWWAVAFGVVACDRDYPVSATYCDDWCEWMVRACPEPYDPAVCVADCERRRKDDARPCVVEHQVFLDCVQVTVQANQYCAAPPYSGVCAPEQEALDWCQVGGAEGIAARECNSYCGQLPDWGTECSAGNSLACQNDCMRRGLGHARCVAEREAVSLCLYDGPESLPCDVWQDDSAPCGAERSALVACAATTLETGGD